MKKLISNNKEETIKFAKEFALTLKNGDIIALIGDLGSGKTVFTKGIAEGLGIKDLITSPTFTILNEYNINNVSLYHFDLYRISNIDELEAIGFFDFIYSEGISIIEWAERCLEELPDYAYIVKLKYLDENKREITIKQKKEK